MLRHRVADRGGLGWSCRLRVDWIKCDGYGLCGDLAARPDRPRRVALPDRSGPGRSTGGHLDDARRAVDCCPMKALILEPIPADRPR